MKKQKRWIAFILASVLAAGTMQNTIYAEEQSMEQEEIIEQIKLLDGEINNINMDHDVLALLYMCNSYEVKALADYNSETVASIVTGQSVFIKGIEMGNDSIWYRVRFAVNDTEYEGYIQKGYLAYSDEALIQAESEMLSDVSTAFYASTGYSDIDFFPTSYQKFLYDMKKQHPNWTFVPMNTGLNWSDVVWNELYQDRSLVPSGSDASWIRGGYSNSWSLASEGILKHYLDPRNYLNDTNIFAFEQLTYNASYHTESAVQNILNSTFMSGEIPGEGRSYANAFWEIGNMLGVSPFHLACRVYQEQGRGTSPLISGNYGGYEGLYNYFNVGASGSNNQAIFESGLTYARNEGWDTRYKSLLGGAQVISKNYILKGQDTLYLQKYDVDSSYNGLYAHQYMQNIMAPMSESIKIKSAYASAGSVDNAFVFKIPVYNDMPASRCVKPGEPEEAVPEAPVQPVDREAVTNFVTRLYSIALGRVPDEAGLNSWVDIISNRKISGGQAAYGFLFSDEFKQKNLNDADFVEILYNTMFDRAGDEGGKNGWVNILSEAFSREYVFKGFVDSQEFADLCDRYGIDRGTVYPSEARDKNEGLTRFVVRCYIKALGRQYELDGLNAWCDAVLSGRNTPKQVAQSFIFSDEFNNRNLSNEEYVRTLYQTFFDREADEAGFNAWVNVLNSGAEDRNKVLEGFSDSAEFYELLARYGLN